MDALQDAYDAALRHARSQRYPEALQAVETVLERAPAQVQALSLKAALLLELGQTDQALAICDNAIGLDPRSARAHSNRGDVLRQLGRIDEALASYGQAVALQPNHLAALTNRGNTLMDASRPAEALASFDAAVAADPQSATVHSNRACALLELLRPTEALESTDRALAIDPRFAKAWKNRADALVGLRRYQTALENYQAALDIDPAFYEARVGLGSVLSLLCRYDESIAAFEAAERMQPEAPSSVFERSTVRLLVGDFEGGWRDYEARWRRPGFLANSTGFLTPDVLAKRAAGLTPGDLAGRQILLASEQGIGDQLMYASMLPDLLAVAGRVACICDRRLVGLLANSFPEVLFFDSRDGAPANFGRYDLVVASGDLGRLFRNQASDFPGEPYVRPGPAVTAAWADRLGPRRAKLRIGLSWRGGTARTNSEVRSIPLVHLRRLLTLADCEFVSLQYGDHAAEIAAAEAAFGTEIRVLPADEIDDFEQLAGLIANLDLVVSVQTAVVHLSGALGKTCLTMVPLRPEWRYMASSETMPWYRSVRLFRQDAAESWAPVVDRVAEAVAARAAQTTLER